MNNKTKNNNNNDNHNKEINNMKTLYENNTQENIITRQISTIIIRRQRTRRIRKNDKTNKNIEIITMTRITIITKTHDE